ncbi:HET-domain-containing protein [Acephala macrosclerotiorum]|nr:HET-domain-containing protein [Acephala macrosclerotiorum]
MNLLYQSSLYIPSLNYLKRQSIRINTKSTGIDDLSAQKSLSIIEIVTAYSASNFVPESNATQSFDTFLVDTDTDADNSTLQYTRRWAWYCRLPACPDYNSAWNCKTNFLLHLYETPVHREDITTKTRRGRRRLARAWRKETAFDMSEPKERLPEAVDSLDTFKYPTLDTPRTIRLVKLHQETDGFDSPIMCSIRTVSLDDKELRFRAMSYCWGDYSKPGTIWMNGRVFTVRKNLENALRRLRTNQFCCCNLLCSCSNDPWYPETVDKHFTSPKLLWIDALCINQEDNEERGQQVTLMRDIYRRADEVVVWLGEEGPDTIPALRLLHGLAGLRLMAKSEKKALISHVVTKEAFRSYWSALGTFLQRPWWTRIWIVQEILMAQKAMVICGRWCADWDEVSMATALFGHCLDCMDEIIEANPVDQPKEFQAFRRGAGSLIALQRSITPVDFKGFLCLSKNRCSTDPRDRIYALLGMLEEKLGPSVLGVDYTIPTCELYMQVCQVLYEETKSLDFLSMVERDRFRGQDRETNLPSWCPDWTIPTNRDSIYKDGSYPAPRSAGNPRPRALTNKFSFTGDSTAHCEFNFASKRVVVEGFVVDAIKLVQTNLIDLIPNFSAAGTVRYGRRICWQQPSLEEELECNASWLARLKSVHDSERPIYFAEEHLQDEPPEHPRLDILCFTTEIHDLVGMTDSAIQAGDSICALPGANIPCIFRKYQDSESYIFVGLCLLFQMMHGEVMEGLSKGVYSLQKFALV